MQLEGRVDPGIPTAMVSYCYNGLITKQSCHVVVVVLLLLLLLVLPRFLGL